MINQRQWDNISSLPAEQLSRQENVHLISQLDQISQQYTPILFRPTQLSDHFRPRNKTYIHKELTN